MPLQRETIAHPGVLIEVPQTIRSLQAGSTRVSWSKIQQYERCPGNWFSENHASFVDRSAHVEDSCHAIPGILVQRVWEAIVNERIYRRPGFATGSALLDWADKQVRALFLCTVKPLEQQQRRPKGHWRRYFESGDGAGELAYLAAVHGLDRTLRHHLQPRFVQFGQLFAMHGGRAAFFRKLAGTFGPTRDALERAGLDLDGLRAETFAVGRAEEGDLAGGIDFLWNEHRSESGTFDDIASLADGYVMLDGKFRLGPTVEIGQLEFYATILQIAYGKTPSRLGFLCYGTGELTLRDFNNDMTRNALTRIRRYVSGTGFVLSGLTEAHARQSIGEQLSIEQVPNLKLTPGRLACRFCGISARCGAAAVATAAGSRTGARGKGSALSC